MWQSPCGAGSLQGKEVSGIINGQKTQQKCMGKVFPTAGRKKNQLKRGRAF